MGKPRSAYAAALIAAVSLLVASCGGGSGESPPGEPGTNWTIPSDQIFDGGPGPDGIPAINRPVFINAQDDTFTNDFDLVIGVYVDGEYRAYPHAVLNWHEIVNDKVGPNNFVVSYCPLTGSGLAWDVDDARLNPEFGVSGLLYNSNLILYDRDTRSNWSQMLQRAVRGRRVDEVPVRYQAIETTWATWKQMFPDSKVLSADTGHVRNYSAYPYGDYRWNSSLLFPVSDLDGRLHPKMRVVGIHLGLESRAYQISGFGDTTQTINDHFHGQPIVVVGNSLANFGAIYGRELADGTVLTFSPLENQYPAVMQDSEGNSWDLFGTAVSGARTGEKLPMTDSYIAMWFAWATFFFHGTEIYFN